MEITWENIVYVTIMIVHSMFKKQKLKVKKTFSFFILSIDILYFLWYNIYKLRNNNIGGKIMKMVYISDLQKETLELVDNLINENKTHNEIIRFLYDNGYELRVPTKNGYTSKTRIDLFKENKQGEMEDSFVTVIKRKNGLASWETLRLF